MAKIPHIAIAKFFLIVLIKNGESPIKKCPHRHRYRNPTDYGLHSFIEDSCCFYCFGDYKYRNRVRYFLILDFHSSQMVIQCFRIAFKLTTDSSLRISVFKHSFNQPFFTSKLIVRIMSTLMSAKLLPFGNTPGKAFFGPLAYQVSLYLGR